MISVVIPLYNKVRYIAETINSVLNQTFSEFEVIIINDGSTDESLNLVNTFSDERIKVFTIKNSGVSVARNTGVEKSKYDYIAFLDADDYWDKKFLSEIIKLVDENPDRNVFATGRVSKFPNHEVEYDNYFLPQKEENGLVDYLKVISQFLPPVNSSNSVFRKSSLINAGLFKEGHKQHEDHDLWLRVCQENLVVYLNKFLSFYRKDIEDSGSQSKLRFFDFEAYLNTILETKNSIDEERNQYFKIYYNKFILLTFIKNQSGFSKEQSKALINMIQNIVSPAYLALIQLINLLPAGLTYKFLSRLRQ